MRELLERWSRVEPKRCVRGVADVYTAKISGVSVWLNEYAGAREVYPERILGAVIEAVESHGWLWQLGRLPDGGHWARIFTRDASGDPVDRLNCDDGDPFKVEMDASPAAALLAAYLKVLDYQAAVDEYGGTR